MPLVEKSGSSPAVVTSSKYRESQKAQEHVREKVRGHTVLSLGSRGLEVRDLRNRLAQAGLVSEDKDPELFGDDTLRCLKEFQARMARNHPDVLVDGIAGDQTWSLLEGAKNHDVLEAGTQVVSIAKDYVAPEGVRLEHLLQTAANELGGTANPEDIRQLANRLANDEKITKRNTDPMLGAQVAMGLTIAASNPTQNFDSQKWLGFQPQESSGKEVQFAITKEIDELLANTKFEKAVNKRAKDL